MKNNKLNIIALLTLFLGLVSCVEDNDFNLPNTEVNEPSIAQFAKTPFSAVKDGLIQEFKNNNKLVYTFPAPEATATNPTPDPLAVIEGYVVSSDAAGNFYKKIVVQDAAENPTAGFELLLDNTSLSQSYEPGRKVYIVLDGLTVTYDDGERTSDIDPENGVPGKYTLGQLVGDRVDEVVSPRVSRHVFASSTKMELVPTVIKIEDFTGANVNTYVKIEGAQFDTSELPNTFSGEPDDSFDGLRTFRECASGSGIDLQTSTFASFKTNQVPQGRGDITFVLTKDFRAENFVAIVNTPAAISFNDQRCDPVYEEDFQSATDNTDLDITGWVNFAEEGGELWTEQEFRGNGYAEFSGFRTGDASNIGWLISPGIDMDAQTDEFLTFKAAQHHVSDSDNNTLEVLVSTDFDGTNVAAATWTKVNANLPTKDSRWYAFEDSGEIDLSSYTGTLYIAFKSVASGTNTALDGSYMIDDVKVSVK